MVKKSNWTERRVPVQAEPKKCDHRRKRRREPDVWWFEIMIYPKDYRYMPESEEQLSHEDAMALIHWIDNKLNQCGFKRYPDHGLVGNIQGSMHCVVSDSQTYRNFVVTQKVADDQKEMAAALVRLRNELAPVEPDMRAICQALGFDPTNHHNAAKCPYCNPPAASPEPSASEEPDDDQPITPKWLWSVGAKEGPEPTDFERDWAFWNDGPHDCSDGIMLCIRRTGANVPYFARVTESDDFGVMIDKPLKTRGDVRKLCSALGVRLEGE